ncbi:MAG: protein-L-isoaspartate(D-aspartate) O-methyltransferase [Thermoanaerobaculia bacterium]|nr:MAG: protein-L-isoaspartate(D-aspartate) O-methyltransferase [Thermoanaerobaculia bacterium]
MRSLTEALPAVLGLISLLAALGPSRARADEFAEQRRRMVEGQIRARDVSSPLVLAAMEQVPRHLFVPEKYRAQAYDDYPLPIGESQTISQPYIVALMTSLLELKGGEKVLEIGTGSGYQAAVLARIAGQVYSMEILGPLAERARSTLGELGYSNVHVRQGDGYSGWPEEAPFDAIMVTAAAPSKVPQPLLDQLKVGGRLVIPLGLYFQDLLVFKRTEHGFEKRNVIPVRFVPMTGEVLKPAPGS